jgi:hypothetical protein
VKDFCGDYTGFRVDADASTVTVIAKEIGKAGQQWSLCGEPRRYPLSPSDFPFSPDMASPVPTWDIAWTSLKLDYPEKAKELFELVTKGFPASTHV